jgi:hypothetical protein
VPTDLGVVIGLTFAGIDRWRTPAKFNAPQNDEKKRRPEAAFLEH